MNSTTYQEETSTLESNGVKYDLNKLFELAEDKPIKYMEIEHLTWVLEHVPQMPVDRVVATNIAIPILVTTMDDGRELVVDGAHRLQKAVNNHIKRLPYKYLSPKDMEAAIIPSETLS